MKNLLVSLAAATLLCTAGAAASQTSAQIGEKAVKSAKNEAHQRQPGVVDEAVDAVMLTQSVLADLEKNDLKTAKEDLEKAIGKLEVVLAHKDAPALLPIDSSITETEYIGTLESIRKRLDTVKKLLVAGRVQAARRLLDTLQSEIDIVTVNLPLVSYPQALKLAAKYLAAGKSKEARDVLEMALGTLVQSEIVIPVPILKAQALIEAASKIAKSDRKQALKHLEAARSELKIAKALGYTSESDTTYKTLDEAIEKVEKEVKGPNRAEKLFETLMNELKEFKQKAVRRVRSEKRGQ